MEARNRVVEAALAWCGTPFHDCAAVKGVGVDCAHLLAAVYAEAGVMAPIEIAPYSPQWMLHRSEELFLEYVLERAYEIEESDASPGDMAIWRFGRTYSHGAIIVDWPSEIVHALKPAGRVLASRADEYGLADQPVRFFSLWGADVVTTVS